MANPMLASLGGRQAAGLKNVLGIMQNPSGAVNAAMMEKLKSHPLYAQASQIAAQYGGDWNRAFEETAKANGIDPKQIIGIMRQNKLI
ncbi:MAG: hypothetical protein IJK52_09825 [Oscillospiraceae bacterium]|nr:hypothetical protein [Oscillospiraceae bacterium]